MANPDEQKQIQEAKARVKFLTGRIPELEADETRLIESINARQEELLAAYIEGKTPDKLNQLQAADRERLGMTRQAIAQARQDLQRAEQIANRESVLQYQKQKADFAAALVKFIDRDFSDLLKGYQALEADYWQLINHCPDRNLYPHDSKQIFDVLHGVLRTLYRLT